MGELNSSLCQLNWLLAKGGEAVNENPTPSSSSSTKTISPRVKNDDKPPYSYSQLIKMAIENTPEQRCSLNGIYKYISENYTYYKENRNGSWRNSVRHNLSLNKQFKRLDKREGEKGSLWMCVEAPERRIRAMNGSPPRVNPVIQRIYGKHKLHDYRQCNAEAPSNVGSSGISGHVHQSTSPFIDPTKISLFDKRLECPPQFNTPNNASPIECAAVNSFEVEDDLSDLSLFASFDLSSSFRAVYDQVFHNKGSRDWRQKEAQIDWLKIGMETAGLDYNNEEEMRWLDTERFTEYLTNGFPDDRSPQSNVTTLQCDIAYTGNTFITDIKNTEQSKTNMPVGGMQQDENSEDEFDWNSIV